MSHPKILLVDNDPAFLSTCAEFIELSGYHVKTAQTPEDAERILAEGSVHLAILDVRLINDEDEYDVAGLELAKACNPAVPKIILTAYQTWEAVRESLGTMEDERPPAVYFVAKQEGLHTLLKYIERAFARHVAINWNLVMEWQAHDRLALAAQIEHGLDAQTLLARAEELEDLFRRLFREHEWIRIDRVLWRQAGRVALAVLAAATHKAPESSVVVCGQKTRLAAEARAYHEFAPKAPSETGTALNLMSETTHLAANVYSLAGADLENVLSLKDLYLTNPEKSFRAVLNTLFQKTLAAWNQEKSIAKESSLEDVYRLRLGLTGEQVPSEIWEARVQAVIRKIPTQGLSIERTAHTLTLRFNDQSFSYPDPIPHLSRTHQVEQPVLVMNAPGGVSGETVLADASGHTWLTDFAGAGLSPLLWNYVSLEAAIRFDWFEPAKLQWLRLHEFEQCLTSGELGKLEMGDLDLSVRKPARAIQEIRRLAVRSVGRDPRSYQVGLLFQAARRFLEFDLATPLYGSQLARPVHLLIAAAMLIDRLEGQHRAPTRGIHIERTNHAVHVDGTHVLLHGQSYKLLCYLHDHANRLCTRREIIERVFGLKFDETDESQASRLNTAISRLRDRIEQDPNRPKYVQTELGGGYRLVI